MNEKKEYNDHSGIKELSQHENTPNSKSSLIKNVVLPHLTLRLNTRELSTGYIYNTNVIKTLKKDSEK